MIKKHVQTTLQILIVLAFLFTAASGCHAATKAAPNKALGKGEFESFIDGFFSGVRKDKQIPGMVFAAVKDGQPLYIKGYGVMNLETNWPVKTDRTLFRIGEISEVITATALLQLVAKERLSLDEDVNLYLRRWKLPESFEKPLTLRHIITHTGGFDYKRLEVCAPTSSDERAYAKQLPQNMPARYTQPGVYCCYSNMGYTLVGSIIERYSRQSFAQAVTKHIFTPLKMEHSFFTLTEAQQKSLATGYDSNLRALGYSYRYDMPAVGMSTTGTDMIRFMLAALGEGKLDRSRILPPAYANSMLRRHFTPHPMIDGCGLAYSERTVMGVRTLQLHGDIPGYSSFLMLIPEKNFGLFLAANISGIDFRDDLAKAVIKRFFPISSDVQSRAAINRGAHIPPDVEGFYRTNKISRSTAEKALNILGDQLMVTITDDTLTTSYVKGSRSSAQRWLPAENNRYAKSGDLFRMVDESGAPQDSYLFFARDESGAVKALSIKDAEHTYDRLKPHESYYRQILFMLLFFVLAVTSAGGTMLSIAINNGKLPWEKGYRSATEIWVISTLFCFMQIAFIVGIFVSRSYWGDEFTTFVPYQVKALFVIPLLAGIILAWMCFRLLANMLNPEHHWAEKLLLIGVACIEILYMFFLADWRLLGFMF